MDLVIKFHSKTDNLYVYYCVFGDETIYFKIKKEMYDIIKNDLEFYLKDELIKLIRNRITVI